MPNVLQCLAPERIWMHLLFLLAAEFQFYVVGGSSNGVNVGHYSMAIIGIGVGRWGIPALRVYAPNVLHGRQRV